MCGGDGVWMAEGVGGGLESVCTQMNPILEFFEYIDPDARVLNYTQYCIMVKLN